MIPMQGMVQRYVVSTRAGEPKARMGSFWAGGGMAWLWDGAKGTGSRGAVGRRPGRIRLRVKAAEEAMNLIGQRGGGARKRGTDEGGMGVVRGWRRDSPQFCGEGTGG